MPLQSDDEDQQLDDGAKYGLQSTKYCEPWWHGVGNNTSLGEGSIKSSSAEHLNATVSSETMPSQANDENFGKEVQNLKFIPFSTSLPAGENLDLNSQMELVGHSIVLTSYPFSDAQYCQVPASYGPQLMVPQFYGLHHARMPLPLDMEEEPVYVNAKQYHGILRRRQSRAKAELEKKVIKTRKPYLHESRHLHAMRRARGSGGRFLNTKKVDNVNSNSTADSSGANHLTNSVNGAKSNYMAIDGNRIGNTYDNDQEDKRFKTQHKQIIHNFSNGNSGNHGLSAYNPALGDVEGEYLGQPHGAPQRAIPIK